VGSASNQRSRAVAANLYRRATASTLVRRMASVAIRPVFAALPAARAPARPVFVIGCPRSGTTLVVRALALSTELATLGMEGHALWEAFNHPRRHGWSSNAVGAGDVSRSERNYVYRVMRALSRGCRFLDKTPKNCLRLPYLVELFPDASFVFVRRRAADNVNSLMGGWRAQPRFVSYRLPEPLEGLGELSGRAWSFVLVPGWRDLRHAPLEEVCARQYVECNEAMLDARAELDLRETADVSYEDLVARPSEEIRRLFGELGLSFTDEAAAFAAAIPHTPLNSVTPPRPEKWRSENPAEINRILPLVAPTERRLGY
jgi:Sulfotransferase family